MKHLRHPALILSLVTILVIVGGVLSSQSTAHSLHHDHHKASTHASAICSWMCAAGQIIDVADPIQDAPIYSVQMVEAIPADLVYIVSRIFTPKRGPPLAFL